MPEWIGQIIGKVRIEKFLARGGMAEVYLGTHLTLERPVAVKVLHRHIESEPELFAHCQREAKVMAGLRHPNIVQVYDFDTYEGASLFSAGIHQQPFLCHILAQPAAEKPKTLL
jgi:serine/threonine-protein kinase